MPVTNKRTRKEIRQSVGLLLGAVRQDGGAVESAPTETSPGAARVIDNSLAFGAVNEHRGRWVFATDSSNGAHLRRVIESSPDERSLTVSVPFPSVPDSGWRYELWDEDVSPALVHDFINQAISETTRKGAMMVLSESFHTGGGVNAFNLSDSWIGVQSILWRSHFIGTQIAPLDEPMTALSSNVIAISDSIDFREGIASAKVTLSASIGSVEDLSESSFMAIDARSFDRIEFWYKINTPSTSSNFLVRLLQSTISHEGVRVPATIGDSWTYAVLQLSTPEYNNAITAVRIGTGSSDAGSATIWVDDVKLVRRNSEVWHTVPREFWRIDHGSRKVMFTPDAELPYAKLRTIGVRAPALLDADSAVCEVEPQYVVNSVAAKVLRSRADRRGTARDAAYQQADLYEQLAQAQRLRMNSPANIRWVDD